MGKIYVLDKESENMILCCDGCRTKMEEENIKCTKVKVIWTTQEKPIAVSDDGIRTYTFDFCSANCMIKWFKKHQRGRV